MNLMEKIFQNLKTKLSEILVEKIIPISSEIKKLLERFRLFRRYFVRRFK